MNLLLLLSALLSALTGGASAMRAPVAAHAATAIAAAVEAEAGAARSASRPQQAVPALMALAAAPIAVEPLRLAQREPLYASRRRE